MPALLNSPAIKKGIHMLPCIYFILFFCWIYFGNKLAGNETNLLALVFTLPFFLQLFFNNRGFALVLGILTFLLSLYLVAAYFSDVAKITSPAASLSFLIGGGMIIVLNFIMSILLLKQGTRPKPDSV